MSRPISLIDFAARFEPDCASADEGELEARWYQSACPRLVARVEELGYSDQETRRCTLEMLRQSATRLEMARGACEALSYLLESGIRSILVAGSVARGEATKDSDIDFNVLLTAEYMQLLYTRRSDKAKTSHELLMGLERELRNRLQADLLQELRARGYPESESKVSLKPFTVEQLADFEERKVAFVHLLNLLFGATPVYGVPEFDRLLEELLEDQAVLHGAVLGRIALLRANRDLVRADPHDRLTEESTRRRAPTTPLDAAHTVAAGMSAILCTGLGEGDPQVPYWWTFDAIAAAQIDSYARSALETFFAVVTLCRCGVIIGDADVLGELLEAAFAVLPLALEAIIERLSAQGAADETLQVWEDIAAYVTDPLLALELARDLGMVRG